jgi:hypothetical protein
MEESRVKRNHKLNRMIVLPTEEVVFLIGKWINLLPRGKDLHSERRIFQWIQKMLI